jgi:hypothetical protein
MDGPAIGVFSDIEHEVNFEIIKLLSWIQLIPIFE